MCLLSSDDDDGKKPHLAGDLPLQLSQTMSNLTAYTASWNTERRTEEKTEGKKRVIMGSSDYEYMYRNYAGRY